MSNIAGMLKNEITRLSKKVIRQHITPVQSATAQQRHQLAALKKEFAKLQQEVRKLSRSTSTGKPAAESTEEAKVRFSAKGLTSLRGRLGLSAHNFGLLLGVSTQTVYNWESEKASPRPQQVIAISKLRGIGKKEAMARLANSQPKATRKRAKKAEPKPAAE